MIKVFSSITCIVLLTSCGGLDPRALADERCDCLKKYGTGGNMSWKCDTLGKQNERKMRNNEEAQRAYNVRLQDCMNDN